MPDARDRLLGAVAAELDAEIKGFQAVAGGSINEAARLELHTGQEIFLKHRVDAARAEFVSEAAGLRWLADAEALSVPRVLAHGCEPNPWLALEWIKPGRLSDEGAEKLGRGLARLHRAGAPAHGALPPGSPDRSLRVGPVELDLESPGSEAEPGSSTPVEWPEFYAQRLILPLSRAAHSRGAIDASGVDAIGCLCERIEKVAGPVEPPARLHGDLWSGNVHADAMGSPWLIDPAAYGGHREVDLAMLRLFGLPGGDRTLDAYSESWPLAADHEERVKLWQLFPLLVHAVLFGGSYGTRAVAAARAYL